MDNYQFFLILKGRPILILVPYSTRQL